MSRTAAGFPSARPGCTTTVAAAKKDIVLKVEKLRKAYGPVTIVEGLDLKVTVGEAIALTGRNDVGKSTVLRCLAGTDRPDKGIIEVLGVKMRETGPEIRRNVTTATNDLDSFPDLSVVEYLDLPARTHEIADPDDLVDKTLDEVQLVSQIGQLPSTLSSGQWRRLALATASTRPRRLLVLDEPEQRFDVEGVEWLGTRLKAELQDGLAIVLASYEPSLLAATGAREARLGEHR